MSAALALDPAFDQPERWDRRDSGDAEPGHGPLVNPTRRPRLRLVPTGADVTAAPRPFEMTRRGRLVRTGLVLAVLAVALFSVVGAVNAGAATAHRVTVTSGQTLSEIAAQQLPGLPTRQGVAAIQLANGLSVSDIHAGQVLTIPVAG